MKLILLSVNSASEEWHDAAIQLYNKKINSLFPFEIAPLKKASGAREQSHKKKEQECEKILAFLKPDDFVLLFDENGRAFDSIAFSKKIENVMGSGKKRFILICGGAYGVDTKIKDRADITVTLSTFVLNHLVAQVVILEQVYRGLTILKNLPYHNV